MLAAAGHATRLRMLIELLDAPAFVSTLARQTGVRVAYASQQLAVLREAGLVCARRRGKQVEYALADAHVGILVAKAVAIGRER